MFCTNCGAKNTSDANFCKQCGHKTLKVSSPKMSDEEFALPPSDDEKVKELLVKAFTTYEAGMIEEAITICEAALLLRPKSTDVHSLMSTLLEKKGDIEKAISERERVLELNPGSIADREKLDELRGEKPKFKPGKINYSRPIASSSFMDSPATQAVVAILVVVSILGVGAWAVISGRNRTNTADNPSEKTIVSNDPNSFNSFTQQPGRGGSPFFQNNQNSNGLIQQQNAPVDNRLVNRPATQQNPSANNLNNDGLANRSVSPNMNVRQIGPAPVTLGSQGAPTQDNGNRSETVHLPEGNGSNPGNGLTIGNGNAPSGTNPTPPNNPRPQGRIEIVVAPNQGFPNTTPGTSTNTGIKIAPETLGVNTVSNGGSDYRAEGRRLQVQGQYKRAITQYLKALDGAGDDAASIHQNIAICYQRLEDNGSAIEHYNAAIKAFKEQIAAGKNVEAANRGIRSCESGIKVCQ